MKWFKRKKPVVAQDRPVSPLRGAGLSPKEYVDLFYKGDVRTSLGYKPRDKSTWNDDHPISIPSTIRKVDPPPDDDTILLPGATIE